MFVNRLEEAASDGRTFTLANHARDLTVDIITQLTIERDLQVQSTPEGRKGPFWHSNGVSRTFRTSFKAGQGLGLLDRINFIRLLKTTFHE